MKRELKRRIAAALAVALAVAAALVLALRERPGTEKELERDITVRLVYAFQNSQWSACVEEVVEQFEASHPGIHIDYEIQYEDEVYEDTLTKLAARDELGDIVQLKEPRRFAENGLLAPLPQGLCAQVDSVCRVDGTPYAVAALGATTGVVYNRALFAELGLEPPGSYQEFLSLCAALRRQGITPLGAGGADLWHMEYWMNHFLRSDVLSREPDFLALCAAGERNWSDPLITQMLEHMAQLFRRGFVGESWINTPDAAMAYHLAEGDAAMVFSGPWLIRDALALDSSLELGWFYVPNEAGKVAAGESVDVFWAVTEACARDAERYEAACAFLEFFYSEGVYEQTCASMAGFSTLTDQSRGQYEASPAIEAVAEARAGADLRFSAYVGDENTPPGFEKRLLALLVRLCQGELTVPEAQALCVEYWEQEAAYE